LKDKQEKKWCSTRPVECDGKCCNKRKKNKKGGR
jgi:hypothetical protein